MLFGCQTLKSLDIKGLRMNPLVLLDSGEEMSSERDFGENKGRTDPYNADNTYLVPDTEKGGYQHD